LGKKKGKEDAVKSYEIWKGGSSVYKGGSIHSREGIPKGGTVEGYLSPLHKGNKASIASQLALHLTERNGDSKNGKRGFHSSSQGKAPPSRGCDPLVSPEGGSLRAERAKGGRDPLGLLDDTT